MATGIGTDRSRETLRRLRDNITSGRWPLNSRIPTETELMAEFGVGRSTIREAVRALAAMGMLEPARSRGTFVRALSPVDQVLADFLNAQDVADILMVRRALEVEASRLAALHRTDDDLAALEAAHGGDVRDECSDLVERGSTPGQFHAMVHRASGNKLIGQLYAGLMSGLRASLADGSVASGVSDAERQADHATMLGAIHAGDPDAAARAAAEHADRDLVLTERPARRTLRHDAAPAATPVRRRAPRARSVR